MDDFAKFYRYELSTTYQNKNKDAPDITKVHKFDSLKDLYKPQGDDSFTVFPRMDITDYVYLMGDYQSDNFDSMKAYTTFKIKLDWLEVQKEAYDITQDQISARISEGMTVEWLPLRDYPDVDPSDPSESDIFSDQKREFIASFNEQYNTYDIDYKLALDEFIQ
jgi:hypothetical protein